MNMPKNKIGLFSLIIIISMLFISCSTILNAIESFFSFLGWLVLAVIALGGWIGFLVYAVDDYKDWPLYAGFPCLGLFVFFVMRMFGNTHTAIIVILIISILMQGGILIGLHDRLPENPLYVWLASSGIVSSLCYMFGLFSLYPVMIQGFALTLDPIQFLPTALVSLTPHICIAGSVILSVIPTLIAGNYYHDVGETVKPVLEIFAGVVCLIGGGFAGGLYLGGFWWVVFGIFLGALLMLSIFALSGLDSSGSMLIGFGPGGCIPGAIIFGKYFGGFWWVMLGLLAGFAGGMVIGLIPSGVGSIFWNKTKKEEERRAEAEKTAAEAERKRLEEIERNRPFEEKLAILENKAEKALEKNKKELKEARRQYTQLCSENNNISPDELYEQYRQMERGDDVFNWKVTDFIFSTGVNAAKERVSDLYDIAKYFAARCNVSVCKSKLENDNYTANRAKAVLFVEHLKEIYEKLTQKQKQRKIENKAKELQVRAVNINISDSVKNIEKLAIQYSDTRKEILGKAFRSYPEFKKNVHFENEGTGALVFLVSLAVSNGISKFSDAQELKEKLEREQGMVYKKIQKIRDADVKATAFVERAHEINISLTKAMDAYTKMFEDIYQALYPAEDNTKSKEQRQARKENGGMYFTDEESEVIMQLGTTGRFLLKIVDTKFEGDDDGE
jgi:hypothetical protein